MAYSMYITKKCEKWFFSVLGYEHNFHGVHLFVILGPKTKAYGRMAIDSMIFVFMCET